MTSVPPPDEPSAETEKKALSLKQVSDLVPEFGEDEQTDLALLYFGSPARHSSATSGGAKVNDAQMPPYARAVGEIHKVLRFLPRRLPQIDEAKLPKALQDDIASFQRAVHLYRSRNNALQDFPASGEAGPKDILRHEVTQLSNAAMERYTCVVNSPFWGAEQGPLPLKLPGGETLEITHTDQVGIFLWKLTLASTGLINNRVFPAEMGMAIMEDIGAAQNIISKIDKKLLAVKEPRVTEIYQQVCQEAYGNITDIARTPPYRHALQMGALVKSRDSAASGLHTLLSHSGAASPYPEALATPLECALCIEALAAYDRDMKINEAARNGDLALHDAIEAAHRVNLQALLPLARHYARQAGRDVERDVENNAFRWSSANDPRPTPRSLTEARRTLESWPVADPHTATLVTLIKNYRGPEKTPSR